MSWMQTAKGRAFNLLDPRAEDVDFEDVAYHLSRLARFNGATGWQDDPAKRPPAYSVAQHCAVGAHWLSSHGAHETALAFLLHDAHEAYLGDLTRPLTDALGLLSPLFRVHLHTLKDRIDRAIWRAAQRPAPSLAAREIVDGIDLRLLRTERDQLLRPPPRLWADAVEACEPLPLDLIPLPAPAAERLWLSTLRALLAD